MGLIRPSVLLLALLMSGPAGYLYVFGQIDVTELLTRFLIAVPVAAIMLAFLRMVTANYGRSDDVLVPGTPLNLQGIQPTPVVTPEPMLTEPK
jgi:hypothetical protein